MNLAEISVGQVVTVEHVGGERCFRRRLMELGLLPSTRVELKGVAPLGDPLELLVRGCSLSIRRAEAAQVLVSNVGGSLAPTRADARPGAERSLTAGAFGLMRSWARNAAIR